MQKTRDERVVGEILQPYLSSLKGEHWKDTLANDNNIFLRCGKNVAIFEEVSSGVYRGHYFFNEARGKAAIALSTEMLNWIFNKAEIIVGLTPVENRAACFLSRRLGFQSQGVVESFAGPMEMFIMTKQQWRAE